MDLPKWLEDKLAYLRKSRQDDPNETVEEVLAKHETMLQEYCEREFGGRIPEENIYREVVSGESISAREEIQKVLARVEDPKITGVVVVEPSRLSRGDLTDCGKLITVLRFSKTLVHTPMMTYNLENKMERKFFQDELLRGNDFLEYTKDLLWRGRVAAVKRGCYLPRVAPWGYDKVKKGKNLTLEPNEDADKVKMVFDWYTKEQLSIYKIADRLTDMGIPTPTGETDFWAEETVRGIIKNLHYTGKVYYSKRKTTQVLENGEITKKKILQPEEDVIIADGLHDALIDPETWALAQSRYAVPKTRDEHRLANPMATMLFCSGCGKPMRYGPYSHADDRYLCTNRPHQCTKSAKAKDVLAGLVHALEHSELPALQVRAKNGDGSAKKIQAKQLAKLEKELEDMRDQEANQYELLETRFYTPEVFATRNAALRERMEKCRAAIYKVKSNMPESVDLEERVISLQKAIEALKDEGMGIKEKNRLLRAIIKRVEYTGAPPETRGRNVAPFTLEIFLRL